MHQNQPLSISSPARHAKVYAHAHAYGHALAHALELITAEHLWQVRTITTS